MKKKYLVSTLFILSFIILSSCSNSYNLRSSYMTLDKNEIEKMIKKYDFYESTINKLGVFQDQYERKEIDSNEVVISKKTRLMWALKTTSNYVDFGEAERFASELNDAKYAGFSDWRLPTLEEGSSLLENSKNETFSKPNSIWTGDKYLSTEEWVISFYHSEIQKGYRGSNGYAFCVRNE